MRRALALAALCLLPQSGAAAVLIHGLRLWPAPDYTRIVLDVSGPLDYRLFTLDDPYRVVVDVANARLEGALPTAVRGPLLKDVRVGAHAQAIRFVFDLRHRVVPDAFLLKPYAPYGYRLVVDLHDPRAQAQERLADAAPAGAASRDLLICIDPGHGGEDPGATGVYGTHEKNVVLPIAEDLNRLINAAPGMRSFLTRTGDYFVPLEERVLLATERNADAFIAIHADSMPWHDPAARGASVYALSTGGATREAALLAKSENASDMIGGVSLDQHDNLLDKVLVDMTQTGTISASLELGSDVLNGLRRDEVPIHDASVGQAAFVVLSSPYIPSVLVETDFISNPTEELRLRRAGFQERLARGIFAGLKRAVPLLRARRNLPQTASAGSLRGY